MQPTELPTITLKKLPLESEKQKTQELSDEQQQLIARLAQLALHGNWHDLFEATDQVWAGLIGSPIIKTVMTWRAKAAEQLGKWENAAFSWQFMVSFDIAAPEEAVPFLNQAIICTIKADHFDEAEKLLYDEQLQWPNGDFSSAHAAFRQLGYRLCFHKPEHERLPTLLELPDGSETELAQAHDWSNCLMRLKRLCIADIIHRLHANEFILLYEYCRNPALEQHFAMTMSQVCARYIQRDRVWYRCKLDGPCFTLEHARHLKRKIERLAKVSSRMRADEEDYPDDIEWGAIHRLA